MLTRASQDAAPATSVMSRTRNPAPANRAARPRLVSGPANAILNSAAGDAALAADLRHAPEHEQRDAADGDPLAQGDPQVAEPWMRIARKNTRAVSAPVSQ